MPSCPPSSHLPLFVVRGVEGDPVCSIVWHFPPSMQQVGFPGGASGEEPACQCRSVRDVGSIPGLGRFPGGGNGNLIQYSSLENSMDRGALWATVHGVTKSQT